MNDLPRMIYKISDRVSWDIALANGIFDGAPIDLQDGYIHFSTASQAKETARLHFAGASDLILGEVDTQALGDKLKWEASRGGELFPHLYGKLEMAAVIATYSLPLGNDGVHIFPEHLDR